MQNVVSVVGDNTCPTCEVYKEWLEEERAKRQFYEQTLLLRVGIIKSENESSTPNVVEFPSITRVTTLSQLRRRAQEAARKKVDTNPPLTEAEKLFEESINGKEEA